MVHAHECNRFVSAYVSNPTGWILTPEAMGTLILDGFDTKTSHFICVYGAGEAPHLDGSYGMDGGKRPHPIGNWWIYPMEVGCEIHNLKEKESTKVFMNFWGKSIESGKDYLVGRNFCVVKCAILYK
ncbi:hypothetical protein TNCT_166851 [Trichonephila clavata]|uniref:Uncharacterized protein n=1 Tax=Trichonephila clavata TaxID=2740835 RepID=A0A8X6EYU0_TRICU|nr:hypothetical protein TNCT_166851 [Trichonephila clavata]